MKQLLLLASLLGCTLNITAQNEEPWRNNGHFEIGFSADAWNLEIGYARMFTRWFGIGASLQMDNDYSGKSLVDFLVESADSYDYDDDDIGRVSLIPSFVFRTPALRLSKKTEPGDGLLLQVEPGVMLSIPVNESEDIPDPDYISQIHVEPGSGIHAFRIPTIRIKNTDGKWLYWRVKTSLGYKIGQGFLYVAYNISNYSIYDSRRNIMINGNRVHDFPERRFTGTLSIGANISF